MSSGDHQALCSLTSQDLGESAYGSAASAGAWVALEQNGPWGRAAATESHLDRGLGARLDALVSGVGARLALVRRPGPHADDHVPAHQRHQVLVASSDPAQPWLLRGQTADPAALLGLDVDALAAGDQEAVRRSVPDLLLAADETAALLVCTNGRRDLCCAVRGRPLALEVAARRPGQVWETSHTGGHRFAPTAVLLPSGQTLARLDAGLAVRALDGAASGLLPAALHGPTHDRGLSALSPPEAAAQSAVRSEEGENAWRSLTSSVLERPDPDTWVVQVRHRDGRSWRRTVRTRVGPQQRPASCGKAAEPLTFLEVTPAR